MSESLVYRPRCSGITLDGVSCQNYCNPESLDYPYCWRHQSQSNVILEPTVISQPIVQPIIQPVVEPVVYPYYSPYQSYPYYNSYPSYNSSGLAGLASFGVGLGLGALASSSYNNNYYRNNSYRSTNSNYRISSPRSYSGNSHQNNHGSSGGHRR